MRRTRLTWKGAYHHVMNRGINGLKIFQTDQLKDRFLSFLADAAQRTRIRVFAYCIMDNHFHLVLENSSGKLADFCRLACGTFGSYYRFIGQDRGYVFQGRYKSTLIEDDGYLKQALGYVLFNPVKAGYCHEADHYAWSSINEYFKESPSNWLDCELVEEIFGTRKYMLACLSEQYALYKNNQENTKRGPLLGGPDFLETAEQHSNRRKERESLERRRKTDRYFEPIEKVIQEFEGKYGVNAHNLDTTTLHGKRLRGRLLAHLVDRCGLSFREISKFEPFTDILSDSLRSICRNARERMKRNQSP